MRKTRRCVQFNRAGDAGEVHCQGKQTCCGWILCWALLDFGNSRTQLASEVTAGDRHPAAAHGALHGRRLVVVLCAEAGGQMFAEGFPKFTIEAREFVWTEKLYEDNLLAGAHMRVQACLAQKVAQEAPTNVQIM